jgi:hypothetical protein
VWLQKGVWEDMVWSKPIDFYAFSCGSLRKTAWNLIETAQRKSQVAKSGYIRASAIITPVGILPG